jgi:hypothetical protein
MTPGVAIGAGSNTIGSRSTRAASNDGVDDRIVGAVNAVLIDVFARDIVIAVSTRDIGVGGSILCARGVSNEFDISEKVNGSGRSRLALESRRDSRTLDVMARSMSSSFRCSSALTSHKTRSSGAHLV